MGRHRASAALLTGGVIYAFVAGLIELVGPPLGTMQHWILGVIIGIAALYLNTATK